MDKSLLETFYQSAKDEVEKHSKYRLNFGVYYTPRF